MAHPQALTLSIPSIHCDSCVRRVNAALEKLPGVETVVTDVLTKTTRLCYDAERLSQAQIEQALINAGYPASDQPPAQPVRRGKSLNML